MTIHKNDDIKIIFVAPDSELDDSLLQEGLELIEKMEEIDPEYFNEIQRILRELPKEEFEVMAQTY